MQSGWFAANSSEWSAVKSVSPFISSTKGFSSPSRSSVRVSTTMPELLHFELRRLGLIPFTTICSGPLAAGTTMPPGHMQKL